MVHKEVKKFVTQVTLTIMDVNRHDFGSYFCVAKNPLGESDGSIKLSGNIRSVISILLYIDVSLERFVASTSTTRSWPTTTAATHPNPETSFGQFHSNFGEKQMRHKGNNHDEGSDLSYNPFPPTTKNPGLKLRTYL